MKKLCSLLLMLTTTAAAFAQDADYAMLKIRLSDRAPIAVNVDGRYINRQTNTLTLDGLRPGPHRVEVYVTGAPRSRPVRLYTGTIRLEPGTVNVAVVDVYRRSLGLRTRLMDEQRADGYADNDNYKGDRGESDESRRDIPRNGQDGNGNDIYGDRDNGNYRSGNDDGAEGYGSFPRGRGNSSDASRNSRNLLTQRDMEDLHTRVNSRITDTEKESLMKSVLQDRSLYTDQVREMLRWLSFESTRLEVAKWAYSHAADGRNYWKLEDTFTFSSSKKEFNEAIRER